MVEDNIKRAEGQHIDNIYWDMAGIVMEFESGDMLKFYPMSRIEPKWVKIND